MPTQPSNENPCDPVAQQARQDFLDNLYHQSGRDRTGDPLRATYTGLYQEWTESRDTAA